MAFVRYGFECVDDSGDCCVSVAVLLHPEGECRNLSEDSGFGKSWDQWDFETTTYPRLLFRLFLISCYFVLF